MKRERKIHTTHPETINHRMPVSILNSEKGSVLIVTIWIVLVLAGLVLVFSRSMRVEAITSANQLSSLKAEEIARGAVSFVRARLNEDDIALRLEGEIPYEAIETGDGYFWLLRPNYNDDDSYYYGIRDESAKLNLNSATYEMLLKLPNMTSELAAAIIDWRDSDSDLTQGGAEDEYYLLLDEPYYCKNSELESVEEVLLLKGASRELLYGEDINLNGYLNSNENDADKGNPPDNHNGKLDRGFYEYVTVYSIEPNVNSDGEERINVNDGGNELSALLREVIEDDFKYQQIITSIRFSNFESVLDFYIRTELTEEQFKQIEDKITTSSQENNSGLININTAPKEVLMCLPGLDESEVDALIQKRNSGDRDENSLAWVAVVLPEKAGAVGAYLTTNSYRYSADIISLSGNGRAYQRYRMIADTMDSDFKVLYWKSLKHLGWPLDQEIIASLRSGKSLEEI
ncbi:general secretion pathway protein GspK [Thermodesulfobacteriota bacterium]